MPKYWEYALTCFKDGDNILTICNAGSIATARYGTALAPFYIGKGVRLHAYACETRPVLQGGRLTTWELKQANIDVTLITDNTAYSCYSNERNKCNYCRGGSNCRKWRYGK